MGLTFDLSKLLWSTHEVSEFLKHTDYLLFSLLFIVFHHRDPFLALHDILINLSNDWLQIHILTTTFKKLCNLVPLYHQTGYLLGNLLLPKI